MNTILQKRIEEAAANHKAYAEEFRLKSDTSFICGVDWYRNHQWISVEEALPEIVDGYRSALVIVRSKYNSYDVAKWDEYYKDWITPDYAVANVTHWAEIPSLEGGEE